MFPSAIIYLLQCNGKGVYKAGEANTLTQQPLLNRDQDRTIDTIFWNHLSAGKGEMAKILHYSMERGKFLCNAIKLDTASTFLGNNQHIC